jgi:citrate synthase
MTEFCTFQFDGVEHKFPIVEGVESERAIDISKLRRDTGFITLDDGYSNTGSCESRITYIDGEKGILRYRGYPVEELAANASFAETAYLLVFGELPSKAKLVKWSNFLTENELLHEGMHHHFEGFPPNAHPMAILSAMINASSCFYPEIMKLDEDEESFQHAAARLISQVRTIAAFSYKKSVGQPIIYPKPEQRYVENFLYMMFSLPNKEYVLRKEVVDAVRLLLVLHADHEQNCSTSTVRMVGSSQANLYASAAAGVCALWGRWHGGANQEVLENLKRIHDQKLDVKDVIEGVKKNTASRLMGFGHAVYKNFDPRARIIKEACHKMLGALGINDPLLDIALKLEEAALKDDYFIQRKLYPNVDFYSGIILKAVGIPVNMFTVMFAIGRMPGWVAHWREVRNNPKARIYRPRQVYQGAPLRHYMPMKERVSSGE